MHVLVTGGAGYIGSTLVPTLLAAGHNVTAVDRFYFGEAPLAPVKAAFGDRLKLARADVRHTPASLFEGVDAMVDLAGISNDPACELDAKLTTDINLEASVSNAELAQKAGVKRIVFASSCSVYGHGENAALTEESPLNPVSLYAKCKADAEKRLWALAEKTDICVTALRFATLFGVSGRTRFDLAINVMTKNAYVNRRITVEGGGRQWRPFVHVKDVADAITMTLGQPTEKVARRVFNVGSSANNSRIINLAYRIREHVPATEIILAPTDPDRRDYNVAFDLIERELGWKAKRSIDDGIVEMLEALRAGTVDPDDRTGYTLKTYLFLVEVERTWRKLQLDGHVIV